MALTSVACAVLLAACGSSSSKANSQAGHRSQFLAFSACMRAHGVPNFPDPGAGGGIQLTPAMGINPFSPSFKAAQSSCHKLLPGGGPGGNGPPSPQAKAQMLAVSTCMRAHGVSGFPDPTSTPPSGPGEGEAVLGRDGVFLVIPNTIDMQSPALRQASKACHFPGGPPGAK